MPKRKLSDLTDTNDTAHPQKPKLSEKEYQHLKLQTARLKQKFEFGVTSLSRALKTARGFERQKLGRRQKVAKGGPGAEIAVAHAKRAKSKPKLNVNPEETLRRIDVEIQVLKSLDPTTTAEKYLFKQLTKTKRIAESPVFYRFKQSKEKKIKLEGPRSTEEANVTARLFKSNPVQNVLPGIMEGLRVLFGLQGAGAKGKMNKEKKEDGNGETGKKVGGGEDVSGDESGSEDEVDARVARGADGDVDMEDAESGEDEEDYSHFDARLASDSEDANGDDFSDDGNDNTRSSQPRRSSMSISLSPSRSPSPSQSPPPKKLKSTSASKTPATSTTFLPSLMMGGYWSGSESEPEELEEAPKRKNRMGQQARRALWEKKYGAAANHIKAEQQKGKKGKGKGGRDAGWDLRKGATGDGDRDRDHGRKKFGTGSNAMAMSGKDRFGTGAGAGAGAAKEGPAQSGKSKKAKPQADKPLHPSWEAARKAKEQKAMASFQGKKVVFD
ncbi:Bud-site selection protein [Aspergillus desertorum]